MNPQRHTPLGCILLLAMTYLVAVMAHAQNVVPPSAVQAARMPQYASRLAHRTAGQKSTQSATVRPRGVCSKTHPGWPQDNNVIYSNGPTNGNTDAWNIGFEFVVSDSFTVGNGGATVTGMTFAAWLFPGDTLPSVTIGITSAENGGTVYFNQSLTITQSGCVINNLGFNVCNESATFSGPTLNAGTYWVNLQNGEASDDDSVYWDENSGPSSASMTSVGTIPSESFTILGEATTTTTTSRQSVCVPEQSGNFSVIHDFNGTDGSGPSGVAIDRAGNLYGPTQWDGGSGAGTVYELAQRASSWVFSTLYNFLGGANGSSPSGVIVGPNDNLYGAANGGIQNCNSGYCGFIFGLRPGPTPCLSRSCGWTNNVLYRFTGTTDAYQGGSLASDQAGNLYGVSGSGGAQQYGAIFELSPSPGGWVENILYSFPGGASGGGPKVVIVGNDGDLYGLTGWGGANGAGVVFQLTPSGSGWTENVIYNFTGTSYYPPPAILLQDSSGNFFGVYNFTTCCADVFSGIFMLTPSNGQWTYTQIWQADTEDYDLEIVPNLTLDASGNLWGTIEASSGGCMGGAVDYALIFELARTEGGWQFSTPIDWGYTDWGEPGGALAMDAHGNLYGTSEYCGAYAQGAVWKFSAAQ